MMENRCRNHTVVCKTDVELISIKKQVTISPCSSLERSRLYFISFLQVSGLFFQDFDQIIKGPQLQRKERHFAYLRQALFLEKSCAPSFFLITGLHVPLNVVRILPYLLKINTVVQGFPSPKSGK